MTIDFAKLASGTVVATDQEFPSVGATRRSQPDPAFVELIKAAAKDHKRRELPGRFSTAPYAGRQHANESSTAVAALHRAAKAAGVTGLQVRRFDAQPDNTVRLTFRIPKEK